MKKCLNCKSNIKDKDKYCRNCGCRIQSNTEYIFINIMIILISLGILFIIILFIASYLV